MTVLVAAPTSGLSNYDGSKAGRMVMKYKNAKCPLKEVGWGCAWDFHLREWGLKIKVNSEFFFS